MNKSEEQFCSVLSAAAGEPLIGSAGKANVFFLLEYNGAWDSQAFEKSAIPETIKQKLSGFAKSLPSAKVLLIKQSSRPQPNPIHFYVALANDTNSQLRLVELSAYEDLLDLDLSDLLGGDGQDTHYLQTGPLYLVCTNGRRDPCCARFAVQAYKTLKKLVGGAAWECSHLGGHRFAPNVYLMPFGILYGRVSSQDAVALVERTQARQMQLENLRGRSAYPPAAQAAEYYLRRQMGELALDAYRLVGTTETTPSSWLVSFRTTSGAERRLEITARQGSDQVFESCTLDKSTRPVHYELVNL